MEQDDVHRHFELLPGVLGRVKRALRDDAEIMEFIASEMQSNGKLLHSFTAETRAALGERLWNEQSVFNYDFYRHAIQAVKAHSPERIRRLEQFAHWPRDRVVRTLDLNMEITAAKVVRDLGSNVRQAARNAPEIVGQAKAFIRPPGGE